VRDPAAGAYAPGGESDRLIRFDEAARTVTLSVRDLADDGDYRFSGPTPLSLHRRAALGRQEHEVHQGAREEELSSYRRERSIRYETRLDSWTAVVTGRIDGIYTDEARRTVIEEVKTVVGGPDEIEAADQSTFPAYTRQLQLYRFLLEETSAALDFDDQAPHIALHLCLIALPSRHRRTLELAYDPAACRALVERRLREVIGHRDTALARGARRRALSEALSFPHDEPRPHQAAMTQAIGEALGAGRSVLVSAPPGIGKTAGALLPALRHALSLGGRVFVATSKTTQQAIFAKTIRLMRERGAPVRAVVLQAREKACLNDVVHCHADACQYAADYADKLVNSGAVGRLLEAPLADSAAIKAEAEAHRFCPFEAALDLTADVDVVIGDYNYVFDPGAALKRMFVDEDPDDVVLVIDEAHNLYDRGTAYYSPSLSAATLEELNRALAGSSEPVARRARDVARRLLAHFVAIDTGTAGAAPPPAPDADEDPDDGCPNMLLFADDPAAAAPRKKKKRASSRIGPTASLAAPEPPAASGPPAPLADLAPIREVTLDLPLFQALRDEAGELSVAWFAEGHAGKKGPLDQDPVVALNRLLARFVGVLELGGPEFSTVFRRANSDHDGDRSASLKILCKDPSRQLGRRLRACAGAVAVSATLEPLPFYRDVLGFGPDAALCRFPSPFDPAHREVLVLDRASTRFRQRERDLPIVADAVRAVLASRPGNYLVCCPSFAYLSQLFARLDRVPGFEVVVQERAMSEPDRARVLDRLRRAAEGHAPPVVLGCVQGGIFTEGVDYPGALCTGAIVVGPGLPAVSFERKLVQEHFERQGQGLGFDYAFLYPGMSKVIQAAGRVIRTPSDRGVIVLVGARFATPRYFNLFPSDWYRRHPRELVCDDPYAELTKFWAASEE
jgi:DNA excision repair protein ERCC-2